MVAGQNCSFSVAPSTGGAGYMP